MNVLNPTQWEVADPNDSDNPGNYMNESFLLRKIKGLQFKYKNKDFFFVFLLRISQV